MCKCLPCRCSYLAQTPLFFQAFERNAVTASAMQDGTLARESDNTTGDSSGEPDSLAGQVEEDAIGQPGKRSRCDTMPRSSVAASSACSVLSKSRLVHAIATKTELRTKTVKMVLDNLTSVVTHEVRNAGKATIPGLCTIKARVQNASGPQERHLFGRVMTIKAKPAETIVTVKCLGAFKKSI